MGHQDIVIHAWRKRPNPNAGDPLKDDQPFYNFITLVYEGIRQNAAWVALRNDYYKKMPYVVQAQLLWVDQRTTPPRITKALSYNIAENRHAWCYDPVSAQIGWPLPSYTRFWSTAIPIQDAIQTFIVITRPYYQDVFGETIHHLVKYLKYGKMMELILEIKK